jgi:hypothetical protein
MRRDSGRTSKVAVMVAAGCLVLWLVSAITTDSVAPRAYAQGSETHSRVCSLVTMRGTHGYSYSGTVMGSSIAAAGPITFGGAGNLSATYDVNLGGTVFHGAFTGTYTVNADCTGTVTLQLPLLGISSHGSFVIVDNGRRTYFVGTDSGVTVSGETTKL